jgi:hypothetical protein
MRWKQVAASVVAWHTIVFVLPLATIWVVLFISDGLDPRELGGITKFTALVGVYYLPYVLISGALTGLLILGSALAARTARRGAPAARTTRPPAPGAPRTEMTRHDIDLSFVASAGGVLITLCLVIMGLRVW